MNFERMKAAVKNRELLGLEPFYLLKNVLERQQVNGWGKNISKSFLCIDFYSDDFISGGQIFEEPILQFIECKQPDPNNQLIASPQEQLMGSAKFNMKCKIQSEYLSKRFFDFLV